MQNYASIDDEDKPQERPGFLTSIRWAITEIPSNLRSGATVALVNIPLSIALSIAGDFRCCCLQLLVVHFLTLKVFLLCFLVLGCCYC